MSEVELLVRGDMVGDRLLVTPEKVRRARELFGLIGAKLEPGTVLAVAGPSGSGKSETASLIGTWAIQGGQRAYVLSCDNYAILPPRDNESKRKELYDQQGREALTSYLGSPREILFDRLESIVDGFRSRRSHLDLRFMDVEANRVLAEAKTTDFADIDVLIMEGTWSGKVEGAHLRLFIDASPEKTLEHRQRRGRDPLTPFGEVVLRIEYEKLIRLSEKAHFFCSEEGEIRLPSTERTTGRRSK